MVNKCARTQLSNLYLNHQNLFFLSYVYIFCDILTAFGKELLFAAI